MSRVGGQIAQQLMLAKARENLTEYACYVDRRADAEYQKKWGENPYRADHLVMIASKIQEAMLTPDSRLIIVLPPRFWKSSTLEKAASWYLGKFPTRSVIQLSYAESLANSFSRNIRNIVADNPRFREVFPNVKLKADAREVSKWSLEQAYRYSFRAAGRGSGITGGGANLFLIDDLLKGWEEANSLAAKEEAWKTLTTDAFSRLEPGASVIMVNTRWADDDPIGRIIKAEKEEGREHWELVTYPIWDENQKPLWEKRYSVSDIQNILNRPGMTQEIFDLIYMGKTHREEGSLIKREWFDFLPKEPENFAYTVRYWDLALTEKTTQGYDPDWTASCAGGVMNDTLYLGRPKLFRKEFPDVLIEMMTAKMNESELLHGTGKSLHETGMVQSLIAKGFYIDKIKEDGDKVSRASGWIPLAAARRIVLIGTPEEWEGMLAQMVRFPVAGAHDDAIDMISGIAKMTNFVFDPSDMKEEYQHDKYAFIG